MKNSESQKKSNLYMKAHAFQQVKFDTIICNNNLNPCTKLTDKNLSWPYQVLKKFSITTLINYFRCHCCQISTSWGMFSLKSTFQITDMTLNKLCALTDINQAPITTTTTITSFSRLLSNYVFLVHKLLLIRIDCSQLHNNSMTSILP